MLKLRIKKITILILIVFIQPTVDSSSFAFAKRKTPPKGFSFIEEGGKASQGECDGERKIPRRLTRLKEIAKFSNYMGSELQDPELKGKSEDKMWKHFFRRKDSCNAALAKIPSSVGDSQEKIKPNLPTEDSLDSETEDEVSESAESK